MKVAMVTPYWFPVRGGVTTYVAELSAELRRSFSVDVHILAREGGAPGATVLGGDARAFARRAVVELEKLAPDVVHAHGHWYALLAAVRYRAAHPGVCVVFTLHTEFPRGSTARRRALGRLLSKADVLTALSADLLERTVRSFRGPAHAEVVPPGVAVRAAEPARVRSLRIASGLAGRGPTVAFLGPLVYEAKSHGVAELIRAMKLVRIRHPGALLAVAGDGTYRDELQALAQREIPGGAVFLGTVEDTSAFLSAADVYAHISFQEGFGLAVLEAMACGIPVIATPVGGIPGIIREGENGLLVSGHPRAIADAILRLVDSPELAQRLASRGQAEATTRYTWRRAAERFLQLFGPA